MCANEILRASHRSRHQWETIGESANGFNCIMTSKTTHLTQIRFSVNCEVSIEIQRSLLSLTRQAVCIGLANIKKTALQEKSHTHTCTNTYRTYRWHIVLCIDIDPQMITDLQFDQLSPPTSRSRVREVGPISPSGEAWASRCRTIRLSHVQPRVDQICGRPWNRTVQFQDEHIGARSETFCLFLNIYISIYPLSSLRTTSLIYVTCPLAPHQDENN